MTNYLRRSLKYGNVEAPLQIEQMETKAKSEFIKVLSCVAEWNCSVDKLRKENAQCSYQVQIDWKKRHLCVRRTGNKNLSSTKNTNLAKS